MQKDKKGSTSIPADEVHEDDAPDPARKGRSYANVGGHGARHNNAALIRELDRRERRNKREG